MNLNESLNLWQKLEIRGREELELDRTMHMYSADLKDDGRAYIKFAHKHGKEFATGYSVEGYVKYLDLR